VHVANLYEAAASEPRTLQYAYMVLKVNHKTYIYIILYVYIHTYIHTYINVLSTRGTVVNCFAFELAGKKMRSDFPVQNKTFGKIENIERKRQQQTGRLLRYVFCRAEKPTLKRKALDVTYRMCS
jgi:hypothetical protein